MRVNAFAKINLGLAVGPPRGDGYHELRSVLQAIDWSDELSLEPSESFSFESTAEPNDESNLVVKAVRAYERATGRVLRTHIRLVKHIPSGAGLGGGSSDAAVTLLALESLYGRLQPADRLRILQDLGSDVPFFCLGGRALAVGRGEEVYPLEDQTGYCLVIVVPQIAIETRKAYSWLTVDRSPISIESFSGQFLVPESIGLPDNDFERPVFERYPELKRIKLELLERGAFHASLSGSGSGIYGCFRTIVEARAAAAALESTYPVRVAHPLTRNEYRARVGLDWGVAKR